MLSWSKAHRSGVLMLTLLSFLSFAALSHTYFAEETILHSHLGNQLSVAACSQPADVVFAVDASGSVMKPNFQKLMDAVLQTILLLYIPTTTSGNGARVRVCSVTDAACLKWAQAPICEILQEGFV